MKSFTCEKSARWRTDCSPTSTPLVTTNYWHSDISPIKNNQSPCRVRVGPQFYSHLLDFLHAIAPILVAQVMRNTFSLFLLDGWNCIVDLYSGYAPLHVFASALLLNSKEMCILFRTSSSYTGDRITRESAPSRSGYSLSTCLRIYSCATLRLMTPLSLPMDSVSIVLT